MKLRRRFTVGLFLMMIFVSCSERKETPLPEIIAKGKFFDSYVYKLKINTKGQGFSIHNLTWDKWDSIEDRWVFIDKNKGRVSGDSVSVEMFNSKNGPLGQFKGYI